MIVTLFEGDFISEVGLCGSDSLVLARANRRVRAWNLLTIQEVFSVPIARQVDSCFLTNDGKRLAVVSGGTLRIWEMQLYPGYTPPEPIPEKQPAKGKKN
jgi:hypothetical protein